MRSRSLLVGLCLSAPKAVWYPKLHSFSGLWRNNASSDIPRYWPYDFRKPAQTNRGSNYAEDINARAWRNNKPIENISCFCDRKKHTIHSMKASLTSLTWISLMNTVSFPALMHLLLKCLLNTFQNMSHMPACTTEKRHTLIKYNVVTFQSIDAWERK